MTTPLERYRDIVDDWPAFCAALARPLAPTVLANTLRLDAAELRVWLAREGIHSTPLPWLSDALRLAPDARPGRTVPRLAGLLNIQEAAAMLPVRLLDPRPGERILDLCAAPGNKTAQIALAMGDRGTVVANDRYPGRVGLARRTVARLGLASVAVTRADGTGLPIESGVFDRVMVDVPCSCEGTSRRNPAILIRLQMGTPRRSGTLQLALLEKAAQLCRTGGRIVYATCTYAPEENEAVVARLLETHRASLRLIEPRLDGLDAAPGLLRWRGESFPPELARSWRIYPHDNDTGGFYVAVLEKLAPTHRHEPVETPAPLALDELDPTPWWARLERTYGIDPERFGDYRLVRASRKRLSLVYAGARFAAAPTPAAVGLPLFHVPGAEPRLTTAAACAFGAHATRNVVDLDADQVDLFFRLDSFPVRRDQLRDRAGGADVVVRHRGLGLGVGRLDRDRLESALPRHWYAERARADDRRDEES